MTVFNLNDAARTHLATVRHDQAEEGPANTVTPNAKAR
jgi:hypothetical protein